MSFFFNRIRPLQVFSNVRCTTAKETSFIYSSRTVNRGYESAKFFSTKLNANVQSRKIGYLPLGISGRPSRSMSTPILAAPSVLPSSFGPPNSCYGDRKRYSSYLDPSPEPQIKPQSIDQDPPESKKDKEETNKSKTKGGIPEVLVKMFESAMTTFASLAVLGLAGYGYHKYYKYLILQKMENAFKPGDPVLTIAALEKQAENNGMLDKEDDYDATHWIPREEQLKIDAIIGGQDVGHYHLIVGEKGTGKTSMILDAMQKNDGEGVAMMEAHADPEIFRIRLGKALDFEFHEDYIGSLFSIRGPRDTTALLDIERAFNKLEKIALKRRKEVGRPLVLVINSTHLLRDDEDGRDLLELIQQRAEQWAASSLVTFVLNSDDYWVYERLKQYATRMEVLPVLDLPKNRAMQALKQYRQRYFGEDTPFSILEQVYDNVGGRLTFLSRVAKQKDMIQACMKIRKMEKGWLLSKCWILGEEMDDDVMDEQKYSSGAMVLARALVEKEKEMEANHDPSKGLVLPQIPLHEARQIMTRADFIQSYDHINIFTIDSNAMVRADSVPMQHAFREICSQPGFDEHLEATLDRISAIESLGRTRELVAKDFVQGEKYHVNVKNAKGFLERVISLGFEPKKDEDNDN
ncbi:MAG: hypothetical protein M1834_000807 [Cirrosporium novae-zelandiae]|nr:MAG: hypothetical protein M1834_000807 [Cirrosporium novae-zelandiae]